MSLTKAKGVLSVWKGRLLPRKAVPWQDHWTARTYMIAANLRWLGPGSLILVGDSNLEMIPPHALEGLNAVNAGFGGATAENVLASIKSPMVMAALKANPPKKAIIQVGTNDSRQGADPAAVAKSALALAALLRSLGASSTIYAIPPIEENKTAFRSASVAAAIHEATRQACVRDGVPFIDPYAAVRGSGDVTEDGIHLSRGAVVALVAAIRVA